LIETEATRSDNIPDRSREELTSPAAGDDYAISMPRLRLRPPPMTTPSPRHASASPSPSHKSRATARGSHRHMLVYIEAGVGWLEEYISLFSLCGMHGWRWPRGTKSHIFYWDCIRGVEQ
jgi:hypothetical protein